MTTIYSNNSIIVTGNEEYIHNKSLSILMTIFNSKYFMTLVDMDIKLKIYHSNPRCLTIDPLIAGPAKHYSVIKYMINRNNS